MAVYDQWFSTVDSRIYLEWNDSILAYPDIHVEFKEVIMRLIYIIGHNSNYYNLFKCIYLIVFILFKCILYNT